MPLPMCSFICIYRCRCRCLNLYSYINANKHRYTSVYQYRLHHLSPHRPHHLSPRPHPLPSPVCLCWPLLFPSRRPSNCGRWILYVWFATVIAVFFSRPCASLCRLHASSVVSHIRLDLSTIIPIYAYK